MTPERRELRFTSFDDVMPDVERLLRGHRTVGHWSLGQILRHLAKVLRRVVDLPATTPFDTSLWVSEEKKREVLGSGLIPEGLPAPAEVVSEESFDPAEQAEELRRAIAHFKASSGPVIPHRFLGPLTKAEWDQIQLAHLAHHLSFAVPV